LEYSAQITTSVQSIPDCRWEVISVQHNTCCDVQILPLCVLLIYAERDGPH
jgi:hypothetical protein